MKTNNKYIKYLLLLCVTTLLMHFPLNATIEPITMELKQKGNIVEVHITIAEGAKLIWNRPGEPGYPTALIVSENIKIKSIYFPTREEFKSEYGTQFGYKHNLVVKLEVLSKGELTILMKWLCCGTMCIPGETEKSIILK